MNPHNPQQLEPLPVGTVIFFRCNDMAPRRLVITSPPMLPLGFQQAISDDGFHYQQAWPGHVYDHYDRQKGVAYYFPAEPEVVSPDEVEAIKLARLGRFIRGMTEPVKLVLTDQKGEPVIVTNPVEAYHLSNGYRQIEYHGDDADAVAFTTARNAYWQHLHDQLMESLSQTSERHASPV